MFGVPCRKVPLVVSLHHDDMNGWLASTHEVKRTPGGQHPRSTQDLQAPTEAHTGGQLRADTFPLGNQSVISVGDTPATATTASAGFCGYPCLAQHPRVPSIYINAPSPCGDTSVGSASPLVGCTRESLNVPVRWHVPMGLVPSNSDSSVGATVLINVWEPPDLDTEFCQAPGNVARKLLWHRYYQSRRVSESGRIVADEPAEVGIARGETSRVFLEPAAQARTESHGSSPFAFSVRRPRPTGRKPDRKAGCWVAAWSVFAALTTSALHRRVPYPPGVDFWEGDEGGPGSRPWSKASTAGVPVLSCQMGSPSRIGCGM